MQPQQWVNQVFKKLSNQNHTTKQTNVLIESRTINLTMRNNKKVREVRANMKTFTWFGNPRLHSCLQANQA